LEERKEEEKARMEDSELSPKKKDLSERDLFKIDLIQVFPCFH